MDLVGLIISIAILGIGSLLTGGKKKMSQQQTANQQKGGAAKASKRGQPASSEQPQNRGSVFEPYIDESFSQNTSKERKKHRQNQKKNTQQEYFTYENQPIDWDKTSEMSSRTKVDEVVDEVQTQLQEWFDLRQAIIYQTVMENNYIADMK